MTATTRQAPNARAPSLFRQLFGLFAGAACWTGLEIVSYGLLPTSCSNNIRMPLHGVTLLAIVITVIAGVIAYQDYHGTLNNEIFDPTGRVAFLALFGIIFSALFLLVMVFMGVAAFFLGACGMGSGL